MATTYTLNGQTYTNNTGYVPVGATVTDFGNTRNNNSFHLHPDQSAGGDRGIAEDGVGGAGGRFDPNLSNEVQDNRSNFDQAVVNYGGAGGGEVLGASAASDLASQYGLNIPGFDSSIFAGKTAGDAARLAQEKKDQLLGGTSQNTTYSFNPDSLASTKKASDTFQFSLDQINNDPFSSTGAKNDKKTGLLDTAAANFAKGFDTPQDFYDSLQNNPELQANLGSFIKAGGTPSQIASRITPVTNDITPAQDTASYLSSLSDLTAPKTAEQQKAYDSLTPERQIAQDEIMRQTGIAKQLSDAYFGTENTVGIWQQKKDEAENAKKIIETKELNAKSSLREKAQYEIDKNNADAQIAQSDIETNRLQAKNYMTGMLAKLGALQTTGAAPQALGNLEQKYQQQSQQLQTKLSFANRLIQVNLTSDINDAETDRDDKIQSITEDLTKTEEQITKDVLNAQNAANKEIYNITSTYASKMRTQTDKYVQETKANSDKYLSSFLQLAGKGASLKTISGLIDSNGRIIPNAQSAALFAPKGSGDGTAGMDSNTKKYFMTLPKNFRDAYTRQSLLPNASKPSIDGIRSSFGFFQKNPDRFYSTDSNSFGDITPGNQAKGLDYLYQNSATPEDIQKFHDDREFQAWVLGQVQ